MSSSMPSLPPEPDLYAALRKSGVRPEHLPTLIAASDRETAARLESVDQGFLRALLLAGTGAPPIPGAQSVVDHLKDVVVAPMFIPDPRTARTMALSCNGEIPDMPVFSDPAFDSWFEAQAVNYGIGLYGEDRRVYRTAQFADQMSPERRTRHLGIDIFAAAGTPVFAPFRGRVLSVKYNADPLDYGHTLILAHQAPDGTGFYTLYGHLGASLGALCEVGQTVSPGQAIAHLGDWPENGGWAPHLHFQVMTDLLEQQNGNFFGVGHASLWDVWQAICPDPNLIMRLAPAQLQP